MLSCSVSLLHEFVIGHAIPSESRNFLFKVRVCVKRRSIGTRVLGGYTGVMWTGNSVADNLLIAMPSIRHADTLMSLTSKEIKDLYVWNNRPRNNNRNNGSNVVSTMCSAHVVQAVLSLPTSFFDT